MIEPNPHRLPRQVLPRRYELELTPDLGRAAFDGLVEVTLDVVDATSTVTMNALDLEIDEAWVVTAEGDRLEGSIALDADLERLSVTLPTEVPAGQATFGCRFRGVLNDKLVGFYRSTYTDDAGVEHTIATTQLEATHARQAFPCWDEPDLKAVFSVALVVDDDLIALSNAAEIASEPAGEGRRRVQFADTMVMSTYLVAFVVGPLEVTDPIDVDGVPLRVACVRGKRHLADFALETGAFSLRFLADYYDIPYPADKLDLVAIPDFAFGAMENLGCVTFRETLLLADPATTTRLELERIVDVIAHEIAHMWFGDLVTMRWWNGIWLNEAFATFMEMKTTDAFRPSWNRWSSFGVSRAEAFDTDALRTTRPIEYEVVSPADAEGMFDVLTYEKGAAVVRMLEQYLGEDRFRSGIGHYLQTHSYDNTETTDLWDAIEQATGEPVRRIMDSWIFQGGFPVVEVAERDGVVVLSQERFLFDTEPDDTRWAVPIILTIEMGGAATVEKVLLDHHELEVPVASPPDLVKGNTGATGFYRVRYTPRLLQAIGDRAIESLTAVERFALVDDTWASVVAGTTSALAFVELTEALREETDVSVWRAITTSLTTIDQVVAWADPEAAGAYRNRVGAIVAERASALGDDPIEGEPDTDRELRAVLLAFRGLTVRDPAAIERARRLTDRSLAGDDIEPSLGAAAIKVAVAWGDDAMFDALIDRFRGAATPQEQQRTLYSLVEARDEELFNRMLDFTLETDEVRAQNVAFVLRAALGNPVHAGVAWTRIRKAWDAITARVPSSNLPRMIEGVRDLSDPAVAADVEGFLAEHPVPTGERSVAQHVERMRVSVALAQREANRLPDALR